MLRLDANGAFDLAWSKTRVQLCVKVLPNVWLKRSAERLPLSCVGTPDQSRGAQSGADGDTFTGSRTFPSTRSASAAPGPRVFNADSTGRTRETARSTSHRGKIGQEQWATRP